MRAKAPGHRPAPPLAAVGMLCGEGRARHAILHLTARLTRLDPAAVDPLLDLEDHLLPFAVLHLGDHLRFRAVVEAEMIAEVKDRKSTRLNSSHQIISYAVFCLKITILYKNDSSRRT